MHDAKRVNAAIGLATLRLDGFCSMHAGDREGWFITRREPSHTPGVVINARTTGEGFVAAEILNRHNQVVPGFARGDCVVFRGDAVRHALKWKNAQLSASHTGEDYKLRFWLKNADLFSYLPEGLDPNQPDLARF